MDSIIPLGGFQLPFQKRLSMLYNDTKKSTDFVKEPIQNAEDPEIKVLYRKLRIQKDRLVTWGLEWSDPEQSAEILIDSSLSKAGLGEVAGSIMSTIKDILAEAEPLWHSSRRLAGNERPLASEKSRDQKFPLVTWDKGRFEDLVRDLTVSIDTLYDLSRTRSSYSQLSEAARRRLVKSASTEDFRPFESTRIHAPKQIDPLALHSLRPAPAAELDEADRLSRAVVLLDQRLYSQLTHRPTIQPRDAPVLLEYATFDPIYSSTGIMPPMSRFEKLSSGLQAEPQRSPGAWIGLPRLLGYFEEIERSRLGLVYQFPVTFNPVTFGQRADEEPGCKLYSLADLLSRADSEPKLEAKFRLASNLANTVFDMHSRGIVHGNIVDTSISFCNAVGRTESVAGVARSEEIDIRKPLISSFDLFSDANPREAVELSLYKHPLDPYSTSQSPLASNAESKTFDLYSLAMLLLSIGLWTKLEDLVPDPATPAVPETILDLLSIRCGTLYMKAVQTCWAAVDQEMTGRLTNEQIIAGAQLKTSRYLEACCILDGVSNLDERLGDDLGEPQPQPAPPSIASGAGPSKEYKPGRSPSTTPSQELQKQADTVPRLAPKLVGPKPPSTKMRLYPHVPLPPDIVQQWTEFIMPQINLALRHFYRQNPESIEISLESIGESPHKTRPTVLVVCSSVGKVRGILKRKLGIVFDGTTGFSLRVCRGKLLRSRNRGVGRSLGTTASDDAAAANPGFQERPQNGASIGAWVGDRHLPPVSFGGLIVVDDKPYGMTVHHMLDDPDKLDELMAAKEPSRSMAHAQSQSGGVIDLAAWYTKQYQTSDLDTEGSGNDEFACEFADSDDDDPYSETDLTSEPSDPGDSDDEIFGEPGDIPGIEPGRGEGYVVTQPALDDVEDGFYPSPETQDEDHIDSYSLGKVYASSGIRRRCDDGLIHEVDWALFEFHQTRLPRDNSIPYVESQNGGERKRSEPRPKPPMRPTLYPTAVAPASSIPGLEVQCMARTSGLQTGVILPTLSSVKIYGRTTPSHTWQVASTPSLPVQLMGGVGGGGGTARRGHPIGVPGDSGAWIIDRRRGHLCGHVLAWSERKRMAYICPMEVMLKDIAETLDACEIHLPGGDIVVTGPAVYGCRSEDGWPADPEERRLPEVEAMPDPHGGGGDIESSGAGHAGVSTCGGADEDGGRDQDYDEGVDVLIAEEVKKVRLTEDKLQKEKVALGQVDRIGGRIGKEGT